MWEGGGGGEEEARAPNVASQNIGDKYPKFCPLNFGYDPKIQDSVPIFASCDTRTSQVFYLIW